MFFSFVYSKYDILDLEKHNKTVSFNLDIQSLSVKIESEEKLNFSRFYHRQSFSASSCIPQSQSFGAYLVVSQLFQPTSVPIALWSALQFLWTSKQLHCFHVCTNLWFRRVFLAGKFWEKKSIQHLFDSFFVLVYFVPNNRFIGGKNWFVDSCVKMIVCGSKLCAIFLSAYVFFVSQISWDHWKCISWTPLFQSRVKSTVQFFHRHDAKSQRYILVEKFFQAGKSFSFWFFNFE